MSKKKNITPARRIRELKAELRVLEEQQKKKWHNDAMKSNATKFQKDLRSNKTKAEDIFNKAMLKSVYAIDYEFQSIVYITKKKWIEKFYITDFLIPSIKTIIEIDGEYHFTEEQILKDKQRTKDLKQKGYKVLRFTNTQILNTKNIDNIVNYINRLK